MLKILLVDDEKFAIEGLISLLDWDAFHGELIGTASSGEEACQLMETLHPDVVISDIKMTGMSGIDLSRIVQKKQEHIQMILLSAHSEFEYARQAIQYGVVNYILKPITREKITQLNELLCSMEEKLALRRSSYLAAWDSSLKEQLLEALRTKNRDMLDDFFQSPLFETLMSGDNCNTIGIQLISYLYLYLQEIQVNQDALTTSRNKAIESFLDITSRQVKMDVIITMYYDLLIGVTDQAPSHADTIAAYAFRYIKEHYTDPEFNLSALSYAMHVSLSHLSTVFKQATGTNLSAYVTELRLEKAKSLLPDMQYSITQVSLLSGYNYAKYFAKLFKKKTGATPREFRSHMIQGEQHGN